MTGSQRPIALGFHGLAAAGFGACAALLARDGTSAPGRIAALLFACAAAAAALAALSARALARLAQDPELRALPVRSAASAYLQALVAAAILGVGAQRAQMLERRALVAFCAVSALWLLALGFHLVQGHWLSRHRLVDPLGRALSLSRLSWFRLASVPGAQGRVLLEAGDAGRVLFRSRLAAPANGVRQTLRQAGLEEAAPGGG